MSENKVTYRPFAYIGDQTPPNGTIVIQNLCVGVHPENPYRNNYANLEWYAGPDELFRYIIAFIRDEKPAFYATKNKNTGSYASLVNMKLNKNFTSDNDAYNFIISENKYWTNFIKTDELKSFTVFEKRSSIISACISGSGSNTIYYDGDANEPNIGDIAYEDLNGAKYLETGWYKFTGSTDIIYITDNIGVVTKKDNCNISAIKCFYKSSLDLDSTYILVYGYGGSIENSYNNNFSIYEDANYNYSNTGYYSDNITFDEYYKWVNNQFLNGWELSGTTV